MDINKLTRRTAFTATAVLSFVLIILRFKNPDVSEMRFFLDYWLFILWDAVFALIAFTHSEYGHE